MFCECFLFSDFIALMMEAPSTSETSANVYQTTRRNNPEDSHIHARRCENLKVYMQLGCFARHVAITVFYILKLDNTIDFLYKD
jgi:hypothetical protein